jgi:hypothetical protein
MAIASEPGGDRLTGRVGEADYFAVPPDPRLESFMPLGNWAHVTYDFAPRDAS